VLIGECIKLERAFYWRGCLNWRVCYIGKGVLLERASIEEGVYNLFK